MSPRGSSYYAAGVIIRYRNGGLRFLMMKTTKLMSPDKGLELWQFPGGGEEPHDNGNPLKTMVREIYEETDLILRYDHPGNPEILHEDYVGTRRYFYLASKGLFTGLLRSETKDDRRKTLHPPEWKTYEFVEENLCGSQQILVPKLRNVRDEWLRRR